MSALAEKIRACAEQGMSQKQTAEALGKSHSLISRAARRHNITLKPHPRLDSGDADRYRAAAAEGLGMSEVARRFGVSRQHVLSMAKAHNITFKRMIPVPKTMPLGPLLSKMHPEQRAWLEAETPAGAMLADTIRAIITDAYLDAQEARA